MGPRALTPLLLLVLVATTTVVTAHSVSPAGWLRGIWDAAAAAASRGSAAAAAAPTALHDVIKPAPPVWPQLFSAVLFQNRTGNLALTSLYYDWKRGRNLNLIQTQLGARGEVWDLEHDNGTSFIFSRTQPLCKVLKFDVGILVPDWLSNATLLGRDTTDGFVTDVWTKAEFINYYNDNATDRPVRWTFLGSGGEFHVMRWSPGDALSDAHWQAPPWCFNGSACVVDRSKSTSGKAGACPPSVLDHPSATGRLMRPPSPPPAAPAAAAVGQAQAAVSQSSSSRGSGGGAVQMVTWGNALRRPLWWRRRE